MPVEIERKFLVSGHGWKVLRAVVITQGYLNTDPDRTVRVRIMGRRGFITVKGRATGPSRPEYEYPIPLTHARQLMLLCTNIVHKERRHVNVGGLRWDVDRYFGRNTGLVTAEIELKKPDQPFKRPAWLGQEITDDHRYSNSNLAMKPFLDW